MRVINGIRNKDIESILAGIQIASQLRIGRDNDTALTFAIKHLIFPAWSYSPGLPSDTYEESNRVIFDDDARRILELLITEGKVDINQFSDTQSDESPILLASQAGCIPLIEFLVSHGACCDVVDNDGASPMMRAVEYHQIEAAKVIELHTQNPDDCLLSLALEHSPKYIFPRLYAERRFDISQKVRDCLLRQAVLGGLTRYVKDILADGGNPCLQDVYGYTLLHLTSSPRVASLLTFHGADVNAVTNNNATPLDSAVEHGEYELVAQFLRNDSLRQGHGIQRFTILNGLCDDYAMRRIAEELLTFNPVRQVICPLYNLPSTDNWRDVQMMQYIYLVHLYHAMFPCCDESHCYLNEPHDISLFYPIIREEIQMRRCTEPTTLAWLAESPRLLAILIVRNFTFPLKDLEVARRRSEGSTVGFPDLPSNKWLSRVVRNASQPWCPRRHVYLFSPEYQRHQTHIHLVKTVFSRLVEKGTSHLPFLPFEIWLIVFSFVPRSHFITRNLEYMCPSQIEAIWHSFTCD